MRRSSALTKAFIRKTRIFKNPKKKLGGRFISVSVNARQNIIRFSVLTAVIAAMIVGTSFYTKAEYAKFYPAACLGGWQNTKNAEGEPNVPQNADPALFDDTNSAILESAASQIFCGSFIGEVPKDAEMRTLRLKLSWITKDILEGGASGASAANMPQADTTADATMSADETATTTIVVPLGEDAASSTQEILDAPADAVIELNLDVPSGDTATEKSAEKTEEKIKETAAESAPEDTKKESDTEPSVSPGSSSEAQQETSAPATPPAGPEEASASVAPELPSAPEPPPPAAAESAPVSFFKRLFRFAFAETLSDDTTASTPESVVAPGVVPNEPEPVPEPEAPVEIDTPASVSETAAEHASDEPGENTQTGKTAAEDIATLEEGMAMATTSGTTTEGRNEGTTEQSNEAPTSPELLEVLYTLDGAEWHSLGKVSKTDWRGEFEIPLSAWEDISRLQISVQSLPSLDELPKVYLDGMWLEAEYGDYEEGWSPDMYATESEIEGLPEVRVEGSKIFRFSKTDFRANEEPVFDLSLRADISTSTGPIASTTEQELLDSETNATTTEIARERASTTAQKRRARTPRLSIAGFAQKFQKLFEVHAAPANAVKIVRVSVTGFTGEAIQGIADIETTNGKPAVRITKPKGGFRPGAYELHVDVLRDGTIFSSVQKFTWGVLAQNADKSVYLPGETAYLQMAALDDQGYAMCDADLRLEVENPLFHTSVFTAQDGTIEKTPTCARNNVTDLPDYFLHYPISPVSGAGTYHMTLTNLTNGYRVTDSFEVRPSVPFEVERIGATRINPFAASYAMTMNILAKQDFSGEVIETVPVDFEITASASSSRPFRVEESRDEKYIIFEVDIKSRDAFTLAYIYQAPRVSPQFYLLGPLRFEESGNWFQKLADLGSSDTPVFEEQRQWQLAGDAEATIEASLSSTVAFYKINPKMVFTSDQVGFM
ncbi:MAG: hypothetical protein HYT94_04675, partial [Parcubacteria group bacterium]|nr:hypothetical protein [Parcubacteria group bacterium]